MEFFDSPGEPLILINGLKFVIFNFIFNLNLNKYLIYYLNAIYLILMSQKTSYVRKTTLDKYLNPEYGQLYNRLQNSEINKQMDLIVPNRKWGVYSNLKLFVIIEILDIHLKVIKFKKFGEFNERS